MAPRTTKKTTKKTTAQSAAIKRINELQKEISTLDKEVQSIFGAPRTLINKLHEQEAKDLLTKVLDGRISLKLNVGVIFNLTKFVCETYPDYVSEGWPVSRHIHNHEKWQVATELVQLKSTRSNDRWGNYLLDNFMQKDVNPESRESFSCFIETAMKYEENLSKLDKNKLWIISNATRETSEKLISTLVKQDKITNKSDVSTTLTELIKKGKYTPGYRVLDENPWLRTTNMAKALLNRGYNMEYYIRYSKEWPELAELLKSDLKENGEIHDIQQFVKNHPDLKEEFLERITELLSAPDPKDLARRVLDGESAGNELMFYHPMVHPMMMRIGPYGPYGRF